MSRRKILVTLLSFIAIVALSCLRAPQALIVVYFLAFFIVTIYIIVKFIQIMSSKSERESLRKVIWYENQS
jgi:hypothetical protein